MQNSFFQAICRVGIFMICAQAVIHFRPQESYEKYLKLMVSVMVLIQLLLPIGGFLLGGGGQEAARLLGEFKQELEESMKKAEDNAAEADALLERMTLEELRRQLEQRNADTAGNAGGRESEMSEEGAGNAGGQESGMSEEGAGSDGRQESEIYVEPVKPVVIGGEAPE